LGVLSRYSRFGIEPARRRWRLLGVEALASTDRLHTQTKHKPIPLRRRWVPLGPGDVSPLGSATRETATTCNEREKRGSISRGSVEEILTQFFDSMERDLPVVPSLLVLLLLHFAVDCNGSKVGVCYGRNADDLPTPDKVAQLVQLHSIKYLRIYDSNIQVIKAFANTGVELIVGVPNSDLLPFSQYQSNVDTWLKNSILPYYPATMITYIIVGAEVTETRDNVSALVVPAMVNVLAALKKAGLHKRIKVSSTHSLGILSRSFPPSAGAFDSKYAYFLKPMLEFLVENQSPFMVDLYPYYAYRDSPSNVSLDYALFSPSASDVIDPNTGLVYTNMFDAQLDSIFFALMALNFRTLKIIVTESGWPNKGAAKETAATPDNAQTYNTNLIRHVINDAGTPAKPGEEIDVYIFSLFNENRKPGLESERNWGLFYPDQTSVYSLDWTGRGNVDIVTGANITSSNGYDACVYTTSSKMGTGNSTSAASTSNAEDTATWLTEGLPYIAEAQLDFLEKIFWDDSRPWVARVATTASGRPTSDKGAQVAGDVYLINIQPRPAAPALRDDLPRCVGENAKSRLGLSLTVPLNHLHRERDMWESPKASSFVTAGGVRRLICSSTASADPLPVEELLYPPSGRRGSPPRSPSKTPSSSCCSS
ncbi:hypothetical protein BHE74_00040351, partial [Ensete ventricosum]